MSRHVGVDAKSHAKDEKEKSSQAILSRSKRGQRHTEVNDEPAGRQRQAPQRRLRAT